MSRSSSVLLFGSVVVAVLLTCVARVLSAKVAYGAEPIGVQQQEPSRRDVAILSGGPVRAEPVGDRRSRDERGRGFATRPRSGSTLDVRVSPPEVGELVLVLRRGAVEWGRATTRAGRTRFEELAPGGYLLRAETTGDWMLAPARDGGWSGGELTWQRVDVPADDAQAGAVELQFVRPASLAGAVVDREGAPLAGAVVLVQDVSRPARTHWITVDELGLFRVQRLAPSTYGIAVRNSGAEHLVVLPLERTIGPGERAWVELRPAEGHRAIGGRLVDRALAPVDGVRIVCSVDGHDNAGDAGNGGVRPPASRVVARARTAADGTFRFDGLPDAALCVAIDARELELRADGSVRRLHSGFAPLVVDPAHDDVDMGVLPVEVAGPVDVTGRR